MHAHPPSSTPVKSSIFWLSAVLVVVTLVCGTIGIHEYEVKHLPEGTRHGLSAPYGALQMLILHTPHFDHGMNLWLEIGRWSGATVFFLAALLLFWKWLRRGEHLIRLFRFHGHYVICGLGRKGLEIIQSKARLNPKTQFVIVDPQPDPHLVETIMHHRVGMVAADAAQPGSLQRARVAHASHVVVVTPEDARNVAIAAAEQVPSPSKNHLPTQSGPEQLQKIYRLVKEGDTSFHAGAGVWQGRTNTLNRFSVGIEILGIGTFEEMKKILKSPANALARCKILPRRTN